ncbi:hypothetical protein [Shewanella nanhaiensis]|uniref:Uncharacterized protein n=1 Tax=Shewanella nanhaiensis TaxID=2864872 RepID=A0ABS7EAJ8_9GAMM|nr:hypothetical protein [Shewanella nanhaiensis]MBW8186057.1 hypothetical protein [Shewanella nanhaiensis]
MVKFIQTLGVVIVSVWLWGTAGMTIYYEIDRKIDCVENEGFFKGFFWCETTTLSRTAFYANHTTLFFKAMLWPVTAYDSFLEESHDGSDVERRLGVAVIQESHDITSLDLSHEYLCHQFMEDSRSVYLGEKEFESIPNLYQYGTYIATDDVLANKLINLAQSYYGKSPNNEEFEYFGKLISTEIFNVCNKEPFIHVKKAMIIAAKNV